MEVPSITDLEAELGCFESPSPTLAPKHGHAHSDLFFDAPKQATSRLEPLSKTKCAYNFGDSGTLGWTSPAGELLSIASVVEKSLVGLELENFYRDGESYEKRGEVLAKVLKAPHASGQTIGLSLGIRHLPSEVSWIHNRWPRYVFQHRGLEVRLQYYVKSQSVIQQYQIRNNGQEDATLPFTFATDVCFREHGNLYRETIPIPFTQCSERQMLAQNQGLLMRSPSHRAQCEMALYLNGDRVPLWASEMPLHGSPIAMEGGDYQDTTDKMEKIEAKVEKIINEKGLLSRSEGLHYRDSYAKYCSEILRANENSPHNFANYKNEIKIPKDSTQEFTACIRFTSFRSDASLEDSAQDQNTKNDQSIDPDEKASFSNTERDFAAHTSNSSWVKQDTAMISRMMEAVQIHIELGQNLSRRGWPSEARFYFVVACSIAKCLGKHGNLVIWDDTLSQYAQFLDENNWNTKALEIVKELTTDGLRRSGSRNANNRWVAFVNRLGSILFRNEKFSEAEALYTDGLHHFPDYGKILNPTTAGFLERIAVSQVHQGLNEESYATYSSLLGQQFLPRKIVLSNLGFIKRRQGQFSEALSYFNSALDGSTNRMDGIHARSGLFVCLHQIGTDPPELEKVRPSLIRYVDVNSALSNFPPFNNPFDGQPFSFSIARHLESLLSVHAIPISDSQDCDMIIFVDGDVLNCGYFCRLSYFQFKLLIQCYEYIKSMPEGSLDHSQTKDRIHSACKGHLNWVFHVADTTKTWGTAHLLDGSKVEEWDSDNLSFSDEGAFQFQKLYLYVMVWRNEWKFVMKLLHLKLKKWLKHLEESRHMSNLWVEEEDPESFRPYSPSSNDVSEVSRDYPHYNLSDAASVWLSLLDIETIVRILEKQILEDDCTRDAQDESEPDFMVKEIREWFEDFKLGLSIAQIRSNILKTFKVPKEDVSDLINSSERNADDNHANRSGTWEPGRVPPVDDLVSPKAITVEGWTLAQVEPEGKDIFLLQRAIKQSNPWIQPWDAPVVDASILGLFQGLRDRVDPAWTDTLKLQKERDLLEFNQPRHIALALYASKYNLTLASSRVGSIDQNSIHKLQCALYDSGLFPVLIVNDAPEDMYRWEGDTYEAMSLLLGALFKNCREILPFRNQKDLAESFQSALDIPMTVTRSKGRAQNSMTGKPSASSKINQANVVIAEFLPDWMFPYPDFIRKKRLEIDVAERLKELQSEKSLALVSTKWETWEDLMSETQETPFGPGMADSGTKSLRPRREIWMNHDVPRDEFWERLLEPRLPERAKKRLVELSSKDETGIVMCWLASSSNESIDFFEFFRRHRSSDGYFDERTHRELNIWETELHLGFHEIISVENDEINSDETMPSRIPINNSRNNAIEEGVNTKHHLLDAHKVRPVAISIRFIGDLADRFWTCHFLSSATNGFKGFIAEHHSSNRSYDGLQKFYEEKQGQRKVLELAYVERALSEMKRNMGQVLRIFGEDLDSVRSQDPLSESFQLIHDQSSIYLEIDEKLRSIWERLDASLRIFEQWEKKDNNNPHRSRWSPKDEQHHRPKLNELARKCKVTINNLRTQRGKLQELRTKAMQRHSDLVSFKQLQEARASTQSAADVRLFTYVTIIFLPLSFSTSLFSMAGAPQGSTVYVMVPTAMIALFLTFVVLANMKLMDRHWSFWLEGFKSRAREKMKGSEMSRKWENVSKQLEKATQRQLVTSEYEQSLSYESNWWYIGFWFSYMLQRMKHQAHKGLHAWETGGDVNKRHPFKIFVGLSFTMFCVTLLMIHTVVLMVMDFIGFLWSGTKMVFLKITKPISIDKQVNPQSEEQSNQAQTQKEPGLVQRTLMSLIDWLDSSPRPIKNFTERGKEKDTKDLREDVSVSSRESRSTIEEPRNSQGTGGSIV